MSTQVAVNDEPAENKSSLSPCVKDACSQFAGLAEACVSGELAEAKVHVEMACAILCDPKGVQAFLKEQKLRSIPDGPYHRMRRFCEGLAVASGYNKENPEPKSLTNKKGHIARNATWLVHYVSTKSQEWQTEHKSSPSKLKKYLSGVALNKAKAAFEEQLHNPSGNYQKAPARVREKLQKRLADRALIKGLKSDTYLAPAGRIVPALIRAQGDSKFEVVEVFPDDRHEKVAEKLFHDIEGHAPNADELQLSAFIDILAIRKQLFGPITAKEPEKQDDPDGPRQKHHSQLIVSGEGAALTLAYAREGAHAAVRLILDEPLTCGIEGAGIFRVQSMNACVNNGLLNVDRRPDFHLTTILPTGKDQWHMGYDIGDGATGKSVGKLTGKVLDGDHARDPLIPNADKFAPVASFLVSANDWQKFTLEGLQVYRSGQLAKNEKRQPTLKFTGTHLKFCVFEQDDFQIAAISGSKTAKSTSVSVFDKHLFTACDVVNMVSRHQDIEISTDGKSLVRISTSNRIGKYEVFLPITRSGTADVVTDGFVLASSLHGTDKA